MNIELHREQALSLKFLTAFCRNGKWQEWVPVEIGYSAIRGYNRFVTNIYCIFSEPKIWTPSGRYHLYLRPVPDLLSHDKQPRYDAALYQGLLSIFMVIFWYKICPAFLISFQMHIYIYIHKMTVTNEFYKGLETFLLQFIDVYPRPIHLQTNKSPFFYVFYVRLWVTWFR